MTPEKAALWQTITAIIQAILTLMAVGVAILVPRNIAANDRRIKQEDHDLAERARVVLMRPTVWKIGGEIAGVRQWWSDKTTQAYPGPPQNIGFGVKELRNWIADNQHFSSCTGNQLIDLLVQIENYNSFVGSLSHQNWGEFAEEARLYAEKCRELFGELTKSLEKIAKPS